MPGQRVKPSVTFNINGLAWKVIEGSALYKEPDLYARGDEDAKEACEALHYADVGVRGRGKTYEIATTVAAATVIMEYCRNTGNTFKTSGNLQTRRDGEALLVAADRIYYKIREVNGDAPWQTPGKP
ncbi:hypothetical protein ACXJJ3_08910 [Kribbella sp. WER1]|uniref:hypothetical protein n=1 Tax=Kribbella sp. NPDC059898 TaxID=3346995 RepID=UPI003659C174